MASETSETSNGESKQPESGSAGGPAKLREAQMALNRRRANLKPEDAAPEPVARPLSKYQGELAALRALAAEDPEAAEALRLGIQIQHEAREAESAEEVERERRDFEKRIRQYGDSIDLAVREYGSPEQDWLNRMALFEQTLPVFPGRADETGAAASSFASATAHIPVFLLARTMLAIQRDESREVWRPTIPEIQRRARSLTSWIAARGRDPFLVLRKLVGQPEPSLDPEIEWPEYGEGSTRLVRAGETVLELPRGSRGGRDGQANS